MLFLASNGTLSAVKAPTNENESTSKKGTKAIVF